MPCKYCGKELPASAPGRRAREYCNNACKQAHYRQTHRPSNDIGRLTAKLAEAQERIAAQEQEMSRLRSLLDVEQRFYADTQARPFKAWLRRQRPSALKAKLLAFQPLPPRGSHSLYEAYLRHKIGCTDEELIEFDQMWKLLLTEQM